MKKTMWAKILSVVLILVMAAAWLPMGTASAADEVWLTEYVEVFCTDPSGNPISGAEFILLPLTEGLPSYVENIDLSSVTVVCTLVTDSAGHTQKFDDLDPGEYILYQTKSGEEFEKSSRYVGIVDLYTYPVGWGPFGTTVTVTNNPLYTITVTAGEGGRAFGGGTYRVSETVYVYAIPNYNYIFDGWYENNVKIEDSDENYWFKPIANQVLEARFTAIEPDPDDDIWVIEPQWNWASNFFECNLAWARVYEPGKGYFTDVIDMTGKTVFSIGYLSGDAYDIFFYDEVFITQGFDGGYDFYSLDGTKIASKMDYVFIWPFSENGLAAAKDYNGKWGFIDKFGNAKTPFIYDDAYCFIGDWAMVRIDGKDMMIDKDGHAVLELDEYRVFSDGAVVGSANYYAYSSTQIIVTSSDTPRSYGVIDKDKNFIVPMSDETIYGTWNVSSGFDSNSNEFFYNEFAYFYRVSGSWETGGYTYSYFDTDGNVLTKAEIDVIELEIESKRAEIDVERALIPKAKNGWYGYIAGPAYQPVVPTTFTITTTAASGGSATGGGVYDEGAIVTLTATPYNNYTFDGWYENDAKIPGAGAVYTFTATADRTLQARFTYSPPYTPPYSPPSAEPPDDDTVPDTEPPQAWTNPFTDMSETDWFYDDVAYTHAMGLIQGTAADKFDPYTPLTRGMIVTLLYNIEGKPDVSGLANPFADVLEGAWYTDGVKWASGNGLVGGYPDGHFGPSDNITRQDLAEIFMRYAVFADVELPATRDYAGFVDDADIANYARDAVEAFFKAGIIGGKPGNRFDPGGTATRAECAAIMRRFLQATEE